MIFPVVVLPRKFPAAIRLGSVKDSRRMNGVMFGTYFAKFPIVCYCTFQRSELAI